MSLYFLFINLTNSNKKSLLANIKEIQEMISLSKEYRLESLAIAERKWKENLSFKHIFCICI